MISYTKITIEIVSYRVAACSEFLSISKSKGEKQQNRSMKSGENRSVGREVRRPPPAVTLALRPFLVGDGVK